MFDDKLVSSPVESYRRWFQTFSEFYDEIHISDESTIEHALHKQLVRTCAHPCVQFRGCL